MKNTIWVLASLLVVLFVSPSCERELVDPDAEIQISDNTTANYIRWNDEDDVEADVTETSSSAVTLTLESQPYNGGTFDVTYEISGVPSINGTNTVTFPAQDFELDVDIAIPENALGTDGSLTPVLVTDTLVAAPDTTFRDSIGPITLVITGSDTTRDTTFIPVPETITPGDTTFTTTRTFTDSATITITSVTGGLTIGRGGNNTNALDDELDPVSLTLIITQVDEL